MLLVFLLSCTKKDNDTCYTCTTTWIVTADSQVSGFPRMTTTSVELCNSTSDQISAYENATQGSESNVVDNVLYTSSHSTKCAANQK
jgi:hypothetical protein